MMAAACALPALPKELQGEVHFAGSAEGIQAARRNYLTAREAHRLLNGESCVKVWREKRGRSQRELAAGVSGGYLADIETGRKPGSVVALTRLSKALQVQIEDLIMSRNG